MRKQLSRAELENLHSVLRRAAERAERRNRLNGGEQPDPYSEALAREVAALNAELARAS